MKKICGICFILLLCCGVWVSCSKNATDSKDPVDYVNPYMGNISHLLVPTYPTIHLPNSMLRVYPQRDDYTTDVITGLPLVVTSHRGRSAFSISPAQPSTEAELKAVYKYPYDNEIIRPYYYESVVGDNEYFVRYSLSQRSAIYEVTFKENGPSYLVFNVADGEISANGNTISGMQLLANDTKVYIYAETDISPIKSIPIENITGNGSNKNKAVALYFGETADRVKIRYGISFINSEQAKENLYNEIKDFDLELLISKGKKIWNEALNKMDVNGAEEDKTLFYTSLYRCYERPVNISEYGRYYSAFDKSVHKDDGQPFYTDDWIWDTYRATHPLRLLIDHQTESHILNSFITMAEQMDSLWMPTFPEITGDSRRMNSNHAVATIADAYSKGLTSFDLAKAYEACRKGIQEKTLAPWSAMPAGWLDDFYKKNSYIPALYPGEKETVPEVHSFEKRQPVAVTLGTAYDEWCLSRIASFLNKKEDEAFFKKQGLNYRTLYNSETGFFHPKDKYGKFIEPFDYRIAGGLGAREYYGENNGWIYRWDVQHNIADLISLMGGRDKFNENLDKTFREPLGMSKFRFYAQIPDHTGNVGQFSMANEPSLHIPYLYAYSGKPWMTQKRIHTLINQWFRNDLMGMPGDEDGGGMSAFVVFSMLGFYPVTPGLPMYVIGSPFFEQATVSLSNGKKFTITAENYLEENKYIQSARLNGREWDKPWFSHEEIKNGGELVLVMGKEPNFVWGSRTEDSPPSFE